MRSLEPDIEPLNPAGCLHSGFLSVFVLAMFCSFPLHAQYNQIFWRNESTGSAASWKLSAGSFQSSLTFSGQNPYPTTRLCIATGDFNRDGKLDSVWRNNDTTGENHVSYGYYDSYGNSDTWSLSNLALIQPLSDSNWRLVGTGYFNGTTDKSIDLVWRNSVTGDNAIWFMEGSQLVSTALIQEVPDLNWKVGGTGDFNNDGYTDILWRHGTSGVNAIWFMQGANLITTALIQSVSDSNWDIVGSDYYNNDNKSDIVWRNRSTGDNALWFMDGTSLTSTQNLPWAALDWKVCGTGLSSRDVDGDALGDVWERTYFGNLDRNGQGNLDGDYYSDSYEYANGKDPTRRDDNQSYQDGLDYAAVSFTGSWSFFQTADFESMENPPFSGYSLFDGDCVGSSDVSQGNSSSIQTTVVGPGTLLFRWATSSSSGDDRLTFYIDDVSQAWTDSWGWQTRKFSVSAGSHTLRWTWVKNSDAAEEGDYRGYLDHLEFYPPGTGSAASLGDALENTGFSWSLSGSPGWTAQSDVYSPYGGGDSAQKTGNTASFSASQGGGILSFYWKAGDADISLRVGGVYVTGISGSTDWIPVLLQINSGEIKWESSGSTGWCWVDKVTYYPDGDYDGLPDQWETQYFGGTTTQNGITDYDADGISDVLEFWNGTNPTQAELKVKIATPRKTSLLP